MFQSFEASTSPDQGPPRLKALRAAMTAAGVDGFLVPRADAFQGEYVAPCDDRLAWLTGFTGSAGFCIALADTAGVFVDGRYTLQAKDQIADAFTPIHWPATQVWDWLKTALPAGGTIGFDPWLYSRDQIETLAKNLGGSGITLRASENLVDQVWTDRPAPPNAPIRPFPIENAGETSQAKRARLADGLKADGHDAAILTQPDSICWLLNIRGGDIARNPVAHAFAVLRQNSGVALFSDAENMAELAEHFGTEITLHARGDLLNYLAELDGPTLIDGATAPLAISATIKHPVWGTDPCLLPKARKNAAELSGTRAAHLRDGAAMVEFLAWLDVATQTSTLTEIDVATKLEAFRQDTGALLDISFDSIIGSGPNGAIVHYRVTKDTNRTLQDGDLLLVDSGGQYQDGTTDITRTLPIGTVGEEEKACYTRVLQGMIAMSRMRWPKGLAGRDLDAIARAPLWMAGQDYDHGTGHGVGVYLCVHEGPQRLSRVSATPLEAGMILSNEPGYYREGAFGIRLENLVAVQNAPDLPGGDTRAMLNFETLTFAPLDRRLILKDQLGPQERDWLNAYHTECFAKLHSNLSSTAKDWLKAATAPI